MAEPGRRERLTAAACELMHRQGVEDTTLAHVAQAADVPLGNVYYYFKTKDDLVAAVVDAHIERIEARTAALDRQHRTPRARLKALVGAVAEQADVFARYGCPYGTLCSELSKRAGPAADERAARLMDALLGWVEQQFRAMGRRDARDLAVELVVAYQGSAVVSSALGDPEVLARQGRRLRTWIDALAAGARRKGMTT